MTKNKRVLTFIFSDKCRFSKWCQILYLLTRKAHCPSPVPPRKINGWRRMMNPPRTILDLDPDQKGILFHFLCNCVSDFSMIRWIILIKSALIVHILQFYNLEWPKCKSDFSKWNYSECNYYGKCNLWQVWLMENV